jgi:hypothetical protein
LPSHLAGLGSLAGLAAGAGLGGPNAIFPGLGVTGVPGPQIPPPSGSIGSGLLALGSVAGALVGHQYNQYNQQLKEDKELERSIGNVFKF